ncbi:ImmA/IrrE family metallo-endopeptidase [Listeria booriae]|uniref:ImmA/IrrE family metallo-endopeptidase n=1 Tax=Listeria booriae TaxID=1552123 RepID=A0A842FY12_9LIST|nr:ImmA/IrrE family metallo-endopeptidase [Listeria booriae]MBC2293715.1 ImmA/IrrE family metallo-endopeptidase [Listeria booriae]
MKYLKYYHPTESELRISKLLLAKGIIEPSDLTAENILNKFNLFVIEGDFPLSVHGLGIVLPRGLRNFEYRYQFFHEFVHNISHIGDQRKMDKNTRLKQEKQADSMAMYALIPYHMLHLIDFENNTIKNVCEIFGTNSEISNRRMEQIKNNILAHKPNYLEVHTVAFI